MSIKHLYEDERPSLLLDFANSKTLDPRITFTRNSTGTYVDEMGIIKTAADNEARFDHDPVTGECRGLLLEEERTNRVIWSQNFSQWNNNSQCTITANQAGAPDGTSTSNLWVPNSGTIGLNTSNNGAFSLSVQHLNTDYFACSIYAKAKEISKFSLRPDQYIRYDFDLTDAPFVGGVREMHDVGNGWFRCVVKKVGQFNSTRNYQIHLNTTDGTVQNGTDGMYFWGTQVEYGATGFPTSYIPTSGSTVTRNDDEAEITGTNFTNWYNNSEGTWLFDIEDANSTDDYARIMQTNQQQRFEYSQLSSATGKQLKFEWLAGGDSKTQPGTAPLGDLKLGASYSVGSASPIYNNGTSIEYTSNVPTGAHTAPTELRIFRQSGGAQFLTGTLRSMRYYNTRLSDTTLEALTK